MSALPAQTAKCSGAKPWHVIAADGDSHTCVTPPALDYASSSYHHRRHAHLLVALLRRLTCVARQAQLLQLLGGCTVGPHKVPWPHGRYQRHQTGHASGCQLVLTQIKYCTCMNTIQQQGRSGGVSCSRSCRSSPSTAANDRCLAWQVVAGEGAKPTSKPAAGLGQNTCQDAAIVVVQAIVGQQEGRDVFVAQHELRKLCDLALAIQAPAGHVQQKLTKHHELLHGY